MISPQSTQASARSSRGSCGACGPGEPDLVEVEPFKRGQKALFRDHRQLQVLIQCRNSASKPYALTHAAACMFLGLGGCASLSLWFPQLLTSAASLLASTSCLSVGLTSYLFICMHDLSISTNGALASFASLPAVYSVCVRVCRVWSVLFVFDHTVHTFLCACE